MSTQVGMQLVRDPSAAEVATLALMTYSNYLAQLPRKYKSEVLFCMEMLRNVKGPGLCVLMAFTQILDQLWCIVSLKL